MEWVSTEFLYTGTEGEMTRLDPLVREETTLVGDSLALLDKGRGLSAD